MKRQLILISSITFVFGTSLGYLLSLADSFKKSADSVSALPTAVAAMDDFSDLDMAVILRLVRGGYAGKNMHSDRYVLSRIAKYYLQRSALTPDQQRALGASVILPEIEDLRNSSPELQKIFEAESGPRE